MPSVSRLSLPYFGEAELIEATFRCFDLGAESIPVLFPAILAVYYKIYCI